MAFITNGEKTKMGERLAQLAAHAERFDMLVGFFYFSGIRVVSDALAANEKVVWRVLVGMEAEDEASAPRRGASDGDVRDWFYAKMRATLARERLDTQAFHERLAVVERRASTSSGDVSPEDGRAEQRAAQRADDGDPRPGAVRGADYLAGLRRTADAETVVVTIDKT